VTTTPELNVVLLVETNALLRREVAEFLRGCGYRVIEAATAAEAIDVLGNRSIGVLVTDLQLRDASGFEISMLAKQLQPKVQVIVTRSAERTVAAATDLCDEGDLEYPYHPQQLLERIRRLGRQ
jgi:DNA-binding response OmpR family regulator